MVFTIVIKHLKLINMKKTILDSRKVMRTKYWQGNLVENNHLQDRKKEREIWEGNMKTDLNIICCVDERWMELAQDHV
jgi:hypothetical protein